MPQNPVDKLIEIAQQNQVLLSNILTNQEILIALEQEKKKTEKYKFIWDIAKYGIWVIIIIVSFAFTQKLVSNFSSGLTKSIGNQVVSGATGDLEAILNGYLK